MAMSLYKDLLRAGAERERIRERFQAFLERLTHRGDDLGLPAGFTAKQCRIVILDGEDATRLAGHDRLATRGPGIQMFDVVLGVTHGLVEQAAGDQRTTATAQVRWP